MSSEEAKPKPSSKKALGIIVIVIIIIAAVGAGVYFSSRPAPPSPATTTASQSSTAATSLVSVRVASATVGAVGLVTRIVHDQHIDNKYGLDLQFTYASISAGEENFVARTVDVGFLGPITAAQEQLRGHDIVLFAPNLLQQNSMLVQKNSTINSLDDLKGKNVGFDPKITSSTQYWSTFLKAKGIDINTYFKPTYADVGARVALFQKGQLDAIATFEPTTSILLATGNYRVITTTKDLSIQLFGIDVPFTGWACYRDWCESHKAIVGKLKSVLAEAASDILKDPEAALTKYSTEYGIKSPSAIGLAANQIKSLPLYGTEWDQKVFTSIDDVVKMAAQLGILTRVPSKPVYIS